MEIREEERISTMVMNRLSNLTPSTSKESIQTFTNWILFHAASHPISIQKTLKGVVMPANADHESTESSEMKRDSNDKISHGGKSIDKWPAMLNVYWNILHEMCYSYSSICTGGGNDKNWSKYADFRSRLADMLILPLLEHLWMLLENYSNGNQNDDGVGDLGLKNHSISFNSLNNTHSLHAIKELRDKLDNMHSIWKDVDSFQSPTLLDDIKRVIVKIVKFDIEGALANANSTTSATVTPNADMKGGIKSLSDEKGTASKNAEIQEGQVANEKGETTVKEKAESNSASDVTTPPASPSNFIEDGVSTPTPSMDEDDDKDLFGAGDSDDNNDEEKDNDDGRDNKEIDTKMDIDEEDMKSPETNMGDDSQIGKKRGFGNLDTEIDFESEGIPKGKVGVIELKEPCISIGSMQITRDFKNDYSHGLSSALSLVPKEVYEQCQKALDNNDDTGETIKLSQLHQMPDAILDDDISSAISNIRSHREIIQKQMECRKKIIQLLIKSRCEFGSTSDAEMFYTLDDISKSLQERKAQVLDAMELEGLDFEDLNDTTGKNDGLEEAVFTEFTWLKREEAKLNRDAKKQRSE